LGVTFLPALRGAEGRTVLAIGVFQGDLAVSKREQIAAMDFDAGAVGPCSRERPLRHAPLPADKMARIAPVRIGEGCPDLREASSHRLTACVPGAADIWSCRSCEDTILRHERHEGIDIVAIPCIGKGLQKLRGDLRNHIGHDLSLPFSFYTGVIVLRPTYSELPKCCPLWHCRAQLIGNQDVALYSAGDLVSARRNIEIGCTCQDERVTAIGRFDSLTGFLERTRSDSLRQIKSDLPDRPLTLALSPIAGGEGSLFCYGLVGVSHP